jgi:hypothetical protein
MMRRSFTLLAVLLLLALCAQAEDAYWKTKLRPAMRTLIDDIRILRITQSNLDGIWELEQSPNKWDILELAVPRKFVTEEQMSVISAWIKGGKGLSADHTILSYLLGIATEKTNKDSSGYGQVIEDSPLANGAKEINTIFLGWGSTFKFIRARELNFTPVLARADDPGTIVGVIATLGNGRVLGLSTSGQVDSYDGYFGLTKMLSRREFVDYKDSVRFAFNAILWLAKKEGRLSASTSSQDAVALIPAAEPSAIGEEEMRSMGAIVGSVCNLDGPADNLNVRSKPSTNGAILAKLKNGDKVTVLGRTKDANFWYKVKTKDGLEGYCHKDYLSVDKDELAAVSVPDALGNYVVSVAKAVQMGYKIYDYKTTDELVDIASSAEAQRAVEKLFDSVEYLNSVFKF